MPYRCPNCHEPLDTALRCANGHRFAEEDGVLVLLSGAFGERLRAFLAAFEPLRAAEGRRLEDPAAYEALPGGPAARGQLEWRLRGYDLEVITRRIAARPAQRVLDVSAWNGWLAHRLAHLGHDVTAVDYFVDTYDGLRARRFYCGVPWQTVQLDLSALDVLDERYDLVVLNRCLQFAPDPLAALDDARARVAPGGMLIVTGLQFFRDTTEKARSAAAYRDYLARHGLEFIRPTKAYLDEDDRARLARAGLRIVPYPQLQLANLRARVQPRRPWHAYGLWRTEEV